MNTSLMKFMGKTWRIHADQSWRSCPIMSNLMIVLCFYGGRCKKSVRDTIIRSVKGRFESARRLVNGGDSTDKALFLWLFPLLSLSLSLTTFCQTFILLRHTQGDWRPEYFILQYACQSAPLFLWWKDSEEERTMSDIPRVALARWATSVLKRKDLEPWTWDWQVCTCVYCM